MTPPQQQRPAHRDLLNPLNPADRQQPAGAHCEHGTAETLYALRSRHMLGVRACEAALGYGRAVNIEQARSLARCVLEHLGGDISSAKSFLDHTETPQALAAFTEELQIRQSARPRSNHWAAYSQ